MKRYVLIALYTLIGIALGITISGQQLNNDAVIQQILHTLLLEHFQTMYECKAQATIESLQLLRGSLVLTNIKVHSTCPGQWSWQSNKCIITISPFAWFFTKAIPVQLIFDTFTLHTLYEQGQCAIIPHFQKMVTIPDTPTPFFIHQLLVPAAQARVYDIHNASLVTFHATYEMLWQNNRIKNLFIINDAQFTLTPLPALQLKGALTLTINDPLHKNHTHFTSTHHLQCRVGQTAYDLDLLGAGTSQQATLQLMQHGQHLATLVWRHDGTIQIKSGLSLAPYTGLPLDAAVAIQGNSSALTSFASCTTIADKSARWGATGIWHVTPTLFLYGLTRLYGDRYTGDVLIGIDPRKQHAFLYLHNNNAITLSSLNCAPAAIKLLAQLQPQRYTIDGTYAAYRMHAQGTLLPFPCLPELQLYHKERLIASFIPDAQHAHCLHGIIDTAPFTTAAAHTNGPLSIKVQLDYPQVQIDGTCTTAWYIPAAGTHSNSCAFNLTLDLRQQAARINHATCQLDKGTITIQNAIIDKERVSVPLRIEQCFVRPDPDIYALVSGNLLFEQQPTPTLRGTITLDQCFYKKNILAAQLNNAAPQVPPFLAPTALNIDVETQQPITVKTAFLTGDVHTHLHLANTLEQPAVTGTLDLAQVALHFPYKPLHITQGSVTLLPYQLLDPLINVTAKNRIKKYQVTLRAHGNIRNPIVHLESSPTLSSEKILALLLTGSEEHSLAIAVPTLIIQQLQHLLIGPAMTNSALLSYFKTFTKPFKKVRFIPRLTDQSARGGIRAGLEINYNDKLSAYIQQNLTLTEDTHFEVEYQCTDHVSVKGIKDEHGDLGAEVEMRWKF